METKIDRAGRIVIPKSIQEATGLKPGARVEIDYREGKIEIERKLLNARLVTKGPVTVISIPGAPKMSVHEVNKWIRRARES